MKFNPGTQTGSGVVVCKSKFNKEFNQMSTRTRSNNVVFKSKSDHVRALLDEGKTIAEITKLVPNMGYAFAYGIAKRYGKSETAASRRKSKVVSIENNIVKIITGSGTVFVEISTGKVTKKK